jgi:hypothetical protein
VFLSALRSLRRFLARAFSPIHNIADWAQIVGVPGATLVAFLLGLWKLGPLEAGLIAVGVFAFLFLLAGVRLQHERETGPRLLFVDVDNDRARVIRGGPSGVESGTASPGAVTRGPNKMTNHFVRVQIANDPGGAQLGTRADRVVGRIAFLNEKDEPLIPEIVGRWAETLQHFETGRAGISLDEVQLDIDANALPHPLDIAMKRPGDAHFYAYNHENWTAPDARLEKHRVDVKECRVRVRLRPTNAGETVAFFQLENGGAGDGLRLSML